MDIVALQGELHARIADWSQSLQGAVRQSADPTSNSLLGRGRRAFTAFLKRPTIVKRREQARKLAQDIVARLDRAAVTLADMERSRNGVRARNTSAASCLMPFLRAMDWNGENRDVAEAVPHFRSDMDITDLRATLVNLGYHTAGRRCEPQIIDERLLPCLFEYDGNGDVCVLIGRVDGNVFAFIGGVYRALSTDEISSEGTAYFPSPRYAGQRKLGTSGSWTLDVVRRFKPYLTQLLAISFVSNALAVALPLFTMVIYDRVIGHRSLDALPMLIVGISIAIAADLLLRFVRGRLIGTIAGRVDYLMGISAFAKLIRLPLAYTERPAVSAQMAQIKEFEGIRDFFTGPGVNAAVDLPFVILILLAIAFIGGWLVLVPLTALLVYAIVGFASTHWMTRVENDAGAKSAERHTLIVDTTLNHEAIKREAMDETWLHRFRLLSAEATILGERAHNRGVVVDALSQTLGNLSALAVLTVGALGVLNGSLTVGALIAVMALTWRFLSPIQSLFQTYGRLGRMRRSVKQLDQLLRMADEFEDEAPKPARSPTRGDIALLRVSLRYGNEPEPSLFGVNLKVRAGTMLAIVGPNGSGKSSLLKVMQGLYRPQGGLVTIDGTDVRQIPTRALRRAIAYAPQRADLFYGTIEQNLRLVDPLASDQALRAATDLVGLTGLIEQLPDGFKTRIGDMNTEALPRGFQRRLSIARALVTQAPILLLDEPEQTLDEAGDLAIRTLLTSIKGTRTVVYVSHRPSFIKLADEAVYIRRGLVEYAGAPAGAIAMLGFGPKTEKAA